MKNNTKEKVYQEEKDFFLTYLNKKIAEIDQQLQFCDENQAENFDFLKTKILLLQNKDHFQNIKEHYYLALKKTYKSNRMNIKQNTFFQEPLTPTILEQKYTIKEILSLIYLGKYLKSQQNCEELVAELKNAKITPKSLGEIRKFYENIFSLSNNSNNFSTLEQKLTFSQNFLEIFVNKQHQLFSHFTKMNQRIQTIISNNNYFLQKNPNDFNLKKKHEIINSKKEKRIKFCNQNLYISEEERLNEHKKFTNEQLNQQKYQITECISGYQSDSAGGYSDYIKYQKQQKYATMINSPQLNYLLQNKGKTVKTENYYGDSEKSVNIEERQFGKIIEFDEADLQAENARIIKSDGESENQKKAERRKRKQYHKKLRQLHQEQKLNIKKIWDQQEKQLDDFLLIKKKQEGKKLIQAKNTKNFDTDKDQQI